MDEVIRDFFRQNGSVSFVVTMGIRSRSSTLGSGSRLYVEPKLFVRDTDVGEDWESCLNRLVAQVTDSLPEIYQTPENAMISMNWNGSTMQTKPFQGGSIMTRNEIRISARELLDLLAGRLDPKRFAANHDAGGGTNIFSIFQSHGRMITGAGVERRPEEDDDWVILKFGAGDPAVSDFRMPRSGQPKLEKQG
jgi:hypothetical protein